MFLPAFIIVINVSYIIKTTLNFLPMFSRIILSLLVTLHKNLIKLICAASKLLSCTTSYYRWFTSIFKNSYLLYITYAQICLCRYTPSKIPLDTSVYTFYYLFFCVIILTSQVVKTKILFNNFLYY